MKMERNQKCEKFILDSLRHSPCLVEAFDGREFDKQTVNAAINGLLHDERVHNKGLVYCLGPPPSHQLMMRNGRIPKPKLKIKKNPTGKTSEHKMRAKKYRGDLTDKSSAERE